MWGVAVWIVACCTAALMFGAAIGEVLAEYSRHRTTRARSIAVKDINDDLNGAAHV